MHRSSALQRQEHLFLLTTTVQILNFILHTSTIPRLQTKFSSLPSGCSWLLYQALHSNESIRSQIDFHPSTPFSEANLVIDCQLAWWDSLRQARRRASKYKPVSGRQRSRKAVPFPVLGSTSGGYMYVGAPRLCVRTLFRLASLR